MAATPAPRTCGFCGVELIKLRRPSRTTYYCPHKDDPAHREDRRRRRAAAQIARIEAIIESHAL